MKKTPLDLALQITNKPLVIKSSRALKEASEELTELNQTLDALTADKELITKPLNTALKEARLKYKPAEDALNARIASIRLAMMSYQTNLINTQEAKKTALVEAIASGDTTLETASTSLAKLKSPLARIETSGGGSLTFMAKDVLKVIDLSRIPREYFDLNESRVLADLKAGKEVYGATLTTIQVPRNQR